MADTVGQQLEHDHHEIDEAFARFAESLGTGAVHRASFDDAAGRLRHHIWVEEEYHFPILRAAGLMAPVLVMLREHGEIWDLLDAISTALDQGEIANALELWPQLADVLEQHNMKEERILYPAGDKTLSAGDAQLISEQLDSGQMPTDWVCEMAAHT